MCIFTLFAFSIFGEEIKYKADNLKINFDENGNISSVLLEGNVVIFYKNITIKTEKAIYERKENKIELEKGGTILSDIGEIEVDYLKYSFDEEKGIVYNAKFKSEPFYGKAERIETERNFWEIENGYITTCDLERPHYRISADKIKLKKDEYISGKNMKVLLGEKFNIFYFPRYIIDLKTKKSFFTPSFQYKTRFGNQITLTFNHKIKEEKEYLMSENFLFGTKGLGVGLGSSSEKNNTYFNSFFFKKWQEDKVQPGGYIEINKNFEDTYFLIDWRWMYDNNFFLDFFKEEFFKKAKMYNYFSITKPIGKGILGLTFRENAREEILNIEKLPEIRYFLPYFSIISPIYLTYDFRLTNFYKERERCYLRVMNDFDFTFKKDFNYFSLNPYISLSTINYLNSHFDKFNFITEAGLNFSSVFFNRDISFIPSFSLYTRTVNQKPANLIKFDEFEEKNNGNFLAINLRWDLNSETDLAGNVEVENEYDIGRNSFGNLFLKYELQNKYFKIEGDNEYDIENKLYKFGVNSISYEKEKYKFSIGTRVENESNIFGIETWFEQRLKKDWKYRIGLLYDFNSNKLTSQTYEIWKNIHCLTIDLRIAKDEENFSFYIFVVPSIFFENKWERRGIKWK
jgi:hypothetical protein